MQTLLSEYVAPLGWLATAVALLISLVAVWRNRQLARQLEATQDRAKREAEYFRTRLYDECKVSSNASQVNSSQWPGTSA